MRGGGGPAGRGGPPIRPSNEAIARTYSQPAPFDGWNAVGNLATMRPTEAIQLDNIFPGVQNVTLRKGCIDWATGAPATINSLFAYTGLTISKLFAATAAGIYDVTANGAIGAAVVTCTNGYWQGVMTATSGGNFLFIVNGTDSAKSFDGMTWTIPTITGATTSQWSYVALHKRRLWAVQKNSMNLWYLGTDSIAGAATQFPVGALFRNGGSILAIDTATIDNGNGSDDFFVIVTTNGEIAIYAGTDPSSVSTWALIGVYNVARPVGTKPLYRYGGDLLYLGQTGLLPLSKLQQSTVIDRSSTIGYNIDGAFLDATATYANNKGWQMITYKSGNMLIVNIPVSQDTLSYQFVMNTSSRAWCRFTSWNASCWADFLGDLYFAGGVKVSKAWQGSTDAGKPIIGVCAQAYSKLGMNAQKSVALVRPNFGISGSSQMNISLDNDFKAFSGQTIITYSPMSSSALWDVSLWDTGIWDGGSTLIDSKWQTIPNNLGYMHSFRLQITSSSGSVVWNSTDFAVRAAGIL